MSLLIAGDLVPTNSNLHFFSNGNLKEILGKELQSIWESADYKFFNLEAPITNSKYKIEKCGPNLKADPSCITGIKELNPTCIFLSNNHILDYGESGLRETVDILKKNKIDYVGIGSNKHSLKKTYVLKSEGKSIAFYNCCEHEFSGAKTNCPGANEYDDFKIWEDISKLKKNNDFVIIIYHGGKEHYRYPSPILKKRCETMIDYKADLVVCQHSHCIGCYEDYKGKKIIYGQGNFIFDGKNNEFWNTSILLDISVVRDLTIDFIPIIRTNNGTRLANKLEKEKILHDYYERSNLIKNDYFVEDNYEKYSHEHIYNYLYVLHGNGLLFKFLKKVFGHKFIKIFYRKKTVLRLLNYIECESHRELLIEGLKAIISDENKHKEN